jgi:DNA modification methylase
MVVHTTNHTNTAAQLLVGDARDVLSSMPDGSADCIVTSPPYWAKRDYGVVGQYGHEHSPAGYVDTMRAVFTEARRVLADRGTCWLNLGDSYSVGSGTASGLHAYIGTSLAGRRTPGTAAKNLLGLPWRVALALQDDGWLLRNAVVWHKLVKQPSYWFDLDPIRIPHATHPQPAARDRQRPARATTDRRPPRAPVGPRRSGGTTRPPKYGPHTRQVIGAQRYGTGRRRAAHPNGRNPGDVWSIPTRPYRGPHFAAFPVDIPLRCIAAGCPPGGKVLDPFCGAGTTGLAALSLGRGFIGVDLNPAFIALADERLRHATEPGNDGNEQ